MEPQEKILHSSLALFFKYGIKHVTMDDIARELGMSKKTIYQYYREKDDLVNQLFEMQLKNEESAFDHIHKSSKDPMHEIILISEHMNKMFQNINPVLFKDLQKFYPTAFKLYQKFREGCAQKNILINIKRGMDAGVYRSDLDAEFISNLRLAQIEMLIFGNYFSFEKISFAKTHQLLLDMFVYGICTVKGHKLFNHYKKVNEED